MVRPKEKVANARVLHLRISDRLAKMIEAEAAENAQMVSETLRRIIDEYYKDKEEKYAKLISN
ncbi:MAG: hypothetical protein ACWGQW_09035 [bacterium]